MAEQFHTPIEAVEIRTPFARYTAESADRNVLLEFLAAHVERHSADDTRVGFRHTDSDVRQPEYTP